MASLGCNKPARSQGGFTLVELMAAIAILVVMGTLVATAMVTGLRVMNATTAASNGAVLQQSIDTALSDVLRFASVQVDEGYGDEFNGPVFNTDSYYDATGSPVRDGVLTIEDGRIALYTPAGGTCSVPKSSGIYTDFSIEENSFDVFYQRPRKLFTCTYTIVGPQGYRKECIFSCRTMAEETQIVH